MKALYQFQLRNSSNSVNSQYCSKLTRHSESYDIRGFSLHASGGTDIKQVQKKDDGSLKRSGQWRFYSLINSIHSKAGFVKLLERPTLKTWFSVRFFGSGYTQTAPQLRRWLNASSAIATSLRIKSTDVSKYYSYLHLTFFLWLYKSPNILYSRV